MLEVVFVGDFSYGFYHLEITMKPPPFRRICLELFPPASYRHKSKYREPEGFPPHLDTPGRRHLWTLPISRLPRHHRKTLRSWGQRNIHGFPGAKNVSFREYFYLHQWLILPRHPGEHLLKFGNDWTPSIYIPIKHPSTQEAYIWMSWVSRGIFQQLLNISHSVLQPLPQLRPQEATSFPEEFPVVPSKVDLDSSLPVGSPSLDHLKKRRGNFTNDFFNHPKLGSWTWGDQGFWKDEFSISWHILGDRLIPWTPLRV